MSVDAELSVKRARVAELIERQKLSGLLLGRNSSVGWALAGRETHCSCSSELASALVLYTPQRDFLISNEMEMPRLLSEVLPGLPFEPLTIPWHSGDESERLIAELTGGGPVAGDVPLAGVQPLDGPVAALRYQLTLEEQIRLRELSARAGAALEAAASEIAPGMSEYAVAGLLGEECYLRDIIPLMLLVSTDERIYRFRQAAPTSKPLERYIMLSLCAWQRGLVVSLTRLMHFGAVPADLRKRAEACARVDAAAIAATRPGAKAGDVLAQLQAAYAAEGFSDEWLLHHQGGATGYAVREWLAIPDSAEVVHENQAFAWNPSIAGVRSEDTVLAHARETEVLMKTPNWPTLSIQVGETLIERPAILELD